MQYKEAALFHINMPAKAKHSKTIPAKEKPQKAKKDKDAPKKAMTAFLCYIKENRNALATSNPKLKSTELITKLSEQWKALDPKGREPYEKLSEKDKERYAKQKREYDDKKKKSVEKKEKK